jgi:hypothetical protein
LSIILTAVWRWKRAMVPYAPTGELEATADRPMLLTNPATRKSMGTAPNRTVMTARRGWWTSNQGHTNTMNTPTVTRSVPHAIQACCCGMPTRAAI